MFACGTPSLARAQVAGRYSAFSRRHPLSSRRHRLVAEKSAARENRPLPGRRDLCRGGAPRSRIPTAHSRFGSRSGHRPRPRDFQNARALGRDREIELRRLPLSRAGLSHLARAGAELFQHLFQPARRTDAPAFLPAGESRPVRRSPLDDLGKRNLVHRRISLRHSAPALAQARPGKTSYSRRSADLGERDGWPSEKTMNIVVDRALRRSMTIWRLRRDYLPIERGALDPPISWGKPRASSCTGTTRNDDCRIPTWPASIS